MTLINPDEFHSDPQNASASAAIKLKVPKRVLHFSDGVLEEYSSDEDEVDTPTQQALVDTSSMDWSPWFWYKAWMFGSSTLSVIDYVGEGLASFFGITTPKYYFELEEYKKRESDIKEREEQEKGWSQPSSSETITLGELKIEQPQPVNV